MENDFVFKIRFLSLVSAMIWNTGIQLKFKIQV